MPDQKPGGFAPWVVLDVQGTVLLGSTGIDTMLRLIGGYYQSSGAYMRGHVRAIRFSLNIKFCTCLSVMNIEIAMWR